MYPILGEQNRRDQKEEYFIVSDLHLEFKQGQEKEFWSDFPQTKAKVCICAGDVTSIGLPEGIYYQHFKELCRRFERVIYVPGNHEYYGSNPDSVRAGLDRIEFTLGSVLKVLWPGDTFTYNNQRFVGATMWFKDRPEVHIYKRMMNDCVQIKGLYPWCFTQSNLFLVHLKDVVRSDDIIITHHIPTDVNTSSIWKHSLTQPFFVNYDCERYIDDFNFVKPKAWIYGHTHTQHDFTHQGIHFICNPAGYSSEAVPWKDKVTHYL